MVSVPISSDFPETGLQCLPGFNRIRRFQVIGERCSGTNYVASLIRENVPLEPTDMLGWKHGHPSLLAIPADLVVISVVRRAEDWVRSLFARPWHTTPAMQMLEASDFLRARWETVVDHPRILGPGFTDDLIGQPLQGDRDPLTGLPYDNIAALRRGKLRSHLSYANRGCAFCLVRMERVVSDPVQFVDSFRAGFGLRPRKVPFVPVDRRLGQRFKAQVKRPKELAQLSPQDIAFLQAWADPELEAALGYDDWGVMRRAQKRGAARLRLLQSA